MANRVFTLFDGQTVDGNSDPFALDTDEFTAYVTGQLDGGFIALFSSPDGVDWYPVIGGYFSATKKGQPADFAKKFHDDVLFLRAVLQGAGPGASVTVKVLSRHA